MATHFVSTHQYNHGALAVNKIRGEDVVGTVVEAKLLQIDKGCIPFWEGRSERIHLGELACRFKVQFGNNNHPNVHLDELNKSLNRATPRYATNFQDVG